MTEYLYIRNMDINMLTESVNGNAANGWTVDGPLVTAVAHPWNGQPSKTLFVQRMVKHSTFSEETKKPFR